MQESFEETILELSKEDMKLNPKNPVVRSHEKIHGFFLLYKNNRKVEQ